MSGLLMRPDVLVALMLCADRVPILECPSMMLWTAPRFNAVSVLLLLRVMEF